MLPTLKTVNFRNALKSLADFIYSLIFVTAFCGSLFSCVKSDVVYLNTFDDIISASSYCTVQPGTPETKDANKAAAIQKAKERTLLYLLPQLHPNLLKFQFNRITKKIFYSYEDLHLEEIQYFIEEPHIDQLVKVTAKASRNPEDTFLLHILPGKNILVEEEILKVDDDPNSIQKKIFETAYIRLIDFFSNRTFGDHAPVEIQGYITILKVTEHTEDDRYGRLNIIANVSFLV